MHDVKTPVFKAGVFFAPEDRDSEYGTMRVQELCVEQRPREKALQQGIESLSDMELLALILGSGTRKKPVMDLAADLLKATDNLADWMSFSPTAFMRIDGIREVKALHLVACTDLARRILKARAFRRHSFDLEEVLEWCQMEFGLQPQERFAAVFLDSRGQIISSRILTIGTQNQSLVSVRDAFRIALEQNAVSVLFVHNHPSGDVTPSREDVKTTEALDEAGRMMDIRVLDHLIVGGTEWFSMRQAGYLQDD